jgi:hypothetical protein
VQGDQHPLTFNREVMIPEFQAAGKALELRTYPSEHSPPREFLDQRLTRYFVGCPAVHSVRQRTHGAHQPRAVAHVIE